MPGQHKSDENNQYNICPIKHANLVPTDAQHVSLPSSKPNVLFVSMTPMLAFLPLNWAAAKSKPVSHTIGWGLISEPLWNSLVPIEEHDSYYITIMKFGHQSLLALTHLHFPISILHFFIPIYGQFPSSWTNLKINARLLVPQVSAGHTLAQIGRPREFTNSNVHSPFCVLLFFAHLPPPGRISQE